MNTDNCNHTNTEKNQEEKIFLYTTITGNLQLIHLEQIGYFRYNSKSKLWEAVLNNNHILALRRNTNSQKILSLHPYLIQISQSHIINITTRIPLPNRGPTASATPRISNISGSGSPTTRTRRSKRLPYRNKWTAGASI